MCSNGLSDLEGVEGFASRLYAGDKAALQLVTELGWGEVAAAMGLPLMQTVLQESTSAYAIFFVAQTLRQLVGAKFVTADLVSLESFLSWLIVRRHEALTASSVEVLTRLLCAVVKQGFCDAPELQSFPQRVTAALTLEGSDFSEGRVALACGILVAFIDETERVDGTGRGLIRHKRTGTCFRDGCLLAMFRAASHCLRRLQRTQWKAVCGVVALVRRILLFDFTCSCDEPMEDVMTFEFPLEWAADLVDQSLLTRLFDVYAAPTTDAKFLCDVLEALTPLVSLSASLYASRQQQTEWMNTILAATLSIMESRSHLEVAAVLREFCRLLNRIKPNFTIDELRRSPCYERWVRALAEFTKLCFQNWRHARQAFLSLTSIWAKLVGSQFYCKDGCTLFELLAPEVCLAYMMSNQEQAERFGTDGEAPAFGDYILDADAEAISMEFEFVSQLLRLCGEAAEQYLLQEICSLLEALKMAEAHASPQLSCVCERLACIVTLASSWLSSYRFSRNARALDSSVLVACLRVVRQSCQVSSARSLPSAAGRHLHGSLLAFLRAAWHILLLDRMDESNKLRESLRHAFSLKTSETPATLLLGLVVDEVMSCVCFCSGPIVFEAMQLLSEMAQSPSTAVVLRTLPQFHGNRPVLEAGAMRTAEEAAVFCRLQYHLSRIKAQVHFLGCTAESSWEDFVRPLHEELGMCLRPGAMPADGHSESFTRVICLWRGVFRSCVGQKEYKLLLRQFSPCLFLLTQQLQSQAGTVCGVQLLRLINEITENRFRRINFGANGVEGYHLFRAVSDALSTAAPLLRKALVSGDACLEAWGIKCLRILLHTGRNILTGGYCNLGVLRLYEDKALVACLTALWQAMALVDRPRFCHHEKLARAHLMLAEELLRELHLWFFCELPVGELLHVIHTLEFSLGHHVASSAALASLSAEALGAFTSTLCSAEGDCAEHRERVRGSLLRADPSLFPRLLRLALDVVVSRKCSASKVEALLRTLIALDGDCFLQLAGEFAGIALAAGKDAEVRAAFALLGSSACEAVSKNNNNLFTKQFQHFSTLVSSCLC
ncbi:Importin-beta, N-terminal domain-containing protein [Trypanosoma conorhini]|uniref:Importin-beta, N-terminal domain-containing protein n=1 Tax=Trypanosoma conorhini TaxID=83891 RepID=A0A422QB42_9TRYP|nr:Importin-beta, N-terminal domain-containing protein [Trypanosoma conorhini]RNF27200.1 Importin-beta, N-terminal domain-containing protein [Trypanosoma conorhini]